MEDHKGRLLSFRAGDRAEYLALYTLSRLCYITPIQRQEDFGLADFMCFLGNQSGKYLYAENGFLIQLKKFGQKIEFKEDATKWLKDHANIPLLICIVDDKREEIKWYSCWRLWFTLIATDVEKFKTIELEPEKYEYGNNGEQPSSFSVDHDNENCKIALCNPIIVYNYINTTDEEISQFCSILKYWINLELINLSALRTNKVLIRGVPKWETNTQPTREMEEVYYSYGKDISEMEKRSVACITSLCINYLKNREIEKVEKLEEVLKILPEEYLDTLGKYFARGEYKKELQENA